MQTSMKFQRVMRREKPKTLISLAQNCAQHAVTTCMGWVLQAVNSLKVQF